MSEQQEQFSGNLRTLGSFLAVILPFAQFFFQWLPAQISGLFLNSRIVFVTSFTTLLMSVFVIFLTVSYRYISFKLPFTSKQNRRYLDYIRKIDPRYNTPEEINKVAVEVPPAQLSFKSIASWSILAVFFASLGFIWFGLKFTPDNINAGFIQAILYVVVFAGSVLILTTYTLGEYDRNRWDRNKKERIKKAINLAVENESFKQFPKINFCYAKETTNFPSQLIVEVRIEETNHRIITDSNAEILYAVQEVSN